MSHIGQTHSVYFRAYAEIQQELYEMFAMSSHTSSFDQKAFHLQNKSYIFNWYYGFQYYLLPDCSMYGHYIGRHKTTSLSFIKLI